MKKKKLFCWCDFLVPTGFGNVAENLLKDMYKDFDVTVLGINYHGDKKYDTSKYFVYPVSKDDMLGMRKLPHLIKQENPDIVFLFQDIFHISDIIDTIRKNTNPSTKIVTYFPIDGNPFSKAWGNVFKATSSVLISILAYLYRVASNITFIFFLCILSSNLDTFIFLFFVPQFVQYIKL